MKKDITPSWKYMLLTFVCLSLVGCNLFKLASNVSPTDDTITASPQTPSSMHSTATATLEPHVFDSPANVVYDFVSRMCAAEWANSVNYLTICPGDLTDLTQGYFNSLDVVFAESTIGVEASALVVLPSQSGVSTAIFAIYPQFEVWTADQFNATLACQGDSTCSVEFALEYFDENGQYHADIPGWEWLHKYGDGPRQVSVDLSHLSGKLIEFALAVRDTDEDPTSDYALWIYPHISRDPNAVPPTPAPTQQTPGTIAGFVDMSTAPPYLNDPVLGSSPVAVVFFNLDDGSYWWIHTSLTGHPYYQMTVTPGTYQVAAYGIGVAGLPYVSAGYTGYNPSCGRELQTVSVSPGQQVENIVIADWNWTCGGTAYRPEKPDGVPLP